MWFSGRALGEHAEGPRSIPNTNTNKKLDLGRALAVHAFNPSIWEAEEIGSLCGRRQSGLQTESQFDTQFL